MVRRDSSMLKAERLARIRTQMMMNLKDVVKIDKLLDWIELNIGLSRRKAKEYVELIIRSEGWVQSDGKIAFTVDDLDGETAKMAEKGFKITQSGETPAARWAYFGTDAVGGVVIELIELRTE